MTDGHIALDGKCHDQPDGRQPERVGDIEERVTDSGERHQVGQLVAGPVTESAVQPVKEYVRGQYQDVTDGQRRQVAGTRQTTHELRQEDRQREDVAQGTHRDDDRRQHGVDELADVLDLQIAMRAQLHVAIVAVAAFGAGDVRQGLGPHRVVRGEILK